MLEPSSSTDEQAQIAQLQALVLSRDAEIKERERYIRLLEEALRLMRAEKYGASRERLGEAPGQRGLFNEAEAAMEVLDAVGFEPALGATPLREDKAPEKSPGRKALPAHLPRIEVRHELPALERVCGCGSLLTEIGAETSEQLDYIPAKIQVIRHVRPKYACRHCHVGVKIGPVPAQFLPRSNISARMAAHLITSKFVDGLPFYRLETVLARHGIAVPRGTQAAVAIRGHEAIVPLVNLMDERMRASGYIRIDETPLQVLKSDTHSQQHMMWVRVAGPPGQRLILFDHDPSRSSQVAARLLDGAHGYVQSDGYAAYDAAAASLQLTHVGCFAHLRRRFFEAVQALPKSEQKKNTAAHEIVRRIDALYAIERDIKHLSDEERRQARQARSAPLLDSLHTFAQSLQGETLISGKLGEALGYLEKQWPKLVRYAEDGRLAMDTNLAENAIRPFALGRKAWLFAATTKGAKASAAWYSLTQTAKANGLEPFAYLCRLFERLPHAKTVEDFEALLPFNTFDLSKQ
ncbi:IS66 family transposase [Steroidobacter flavus]|uniref:IS66 family transposase n=1 Tax=Steroidobacter flavus TaxID=1842136 RepID=A0ABV8SY80_9GAMM